MTDHVTELLRRCEKWVRYITIGITKEQKAEQLALANDIRAAIAEPQKTVEVRVELFNKGGLDCGRVILGTGMYSLKSIDLSSRSARMLLSELDGLTIKYVKGDGEK